MFLSHPFLQFSVAALVTMHLTIPMSNISDSSLPSSSFRVVTAHCLDLLLSMPVSDLLTSVHDSTRSRAGTAVDLAGDMCRLLRCMLVILVLLVFSLHLLCFRHFLRSWHHTRRCPFVTYYHLCTQCLFCQSFCMSVMFPMLYFVVNGTASQLRQ